MADSEFFRRRFGVLLPIASLPGPGPIGTLGGPARRWLGWLSQARSSIWQVLPFGPLGYGDSPYSSPSSFAANPLLISVEDLITQGWLDPRRVAAGPTVDPDRVDYQWAQLRLEPLLRDAWSRLGKQSADRREAFEAFRAAPSQLGWLDDWALYAALKKDLGGRSWLDWPEELRRRRPEALRLARRRLAEEIEFRAFVQFLVFEQLATLRNEAQRLGIELFGDIPFYPALDSADVWSRPDLFDLDGDGRPRRVAGVPPDAFETNGQLWGNPIYLWDRHAADGYRWWIDRITASLRFVDWLRLDHFRGFAACWAVPAGEPTAKAGQWLAGPGEPFFEALGEALGRLPLIAEDLGHITEDVRRLRRRLRMPGMRVLQFGFETPDSEHRPQSISQDVVVYTGTQDNDTSRGWFAGLGGAERRRAVEQLGDPERIHWSLLEAAVDSPASWAVAPVQDLLGLGSVARLNMPGRSSGQWAWRLSTLPGEGLANTIRQLVEAAERSPESLP